ncbi:hypothetical protein C8R45DRAFT_1075797 [Mycena sanguinolenta]|nr:hypothetical protein C8R45DRAFT_1075797 [Mycena sanguinolenta]
MQLELFGIPDIRDRLRRNRWPLDKEKSEIQLSLKLAHRRLAEIEAPDATQDSAVALRAYISEYSSLLAPIRRLPTEVLQLIFVHPDIHDREWIRPLMMTMYRPETIGMVSHHWRQVTLEIPILWSSFEVSLLRRDLPYLQRSLRPTRIRLGLSKNSPLSISFTSANALRLGDENSVAKLHAQAVQEITAEFLRHAERWAHVVLPLEYNFLVLLSSVQGRLLRLEELGFGGSTDYRDELERIRIFEDAPKLRSLSLDDVGFLEHREKWILPALPWGHLTWLAAPHRHTQTTEKLLEMSPRLRNVMFSLDINGFNERPSRPRRSREIRKIALNGLDSVKATGFMDALASMETPELKKIYLIRCWAWNSLSIPALLQRSLCSLETLVVGHSRVRPAVLLALFSAIPTLGTLVLVDNFPNVVTDLVLEGLALTHSALNVDVLPMLHTFVLRGTYLCSTGALLTLLEGRMRLQHPVVNVDIALRDRDLGTPDLNRCASLPGTVVATYSSRVLAIYAGSPWQSGDYSEYHNRV